MRASFRWLWAGSGAANLGDGITVTALPLIAVAAGAPPGQVALVTVSATIAWPLFGLHAGWLVDRASPATLLVTVNVARVLALAALAVSLTTDFATFAFTVGAAFVYGVAETLVDTALISTVPRTVDSGQLTAANSRLEATINVANQLAGPPLAGLLIGLSGLAATAVGSGLYALAAIAAVGLAITLSSDNRLASNHPSRLPAASTADDAGKDHGQQSAGSTTPPRGVLGGMRFLWNHRLQRELTVLTAAMSVVWGAWTSVFVLFAVSPGPLGLSPAAYGLLLASMAGGGIVASMLTSRLERLLPPAALLFVDTVGTAGLVLPAALGAPVPVIAAGIIIAGAGSTVWRIIVSVVRQRTTPLNLLGRVYSASRVISWGALPLGAGLAAIGVTSLGVQPVLWIASGFAIVVSLWFAARLPKTATRINIAASEPQRTKANPLFNQMVDNRPAQSYRCNQPNG